MKVFIDTSAFYALADKGDRRHLEARAAYDELTKGKLFTTDHVLVECWFLIGSRLGREVAIRFWDGIRSGIITVLQVTLQDLDYAREAIGRFPDQRFSLVDGTSFAVMEREGIEQVFTFDSHFGIYRFGEDNKRRFAVVPRPPSHSARATSPEA
ncbi:MAG: PIN domain-containing protein [Candidatus Bipolaricaulota bacterium]